MSQEDLVLISQAEREGGSTLITVNCPDKTGLGCDLCRIILLFGLSICRGDFSTDGKWCYIVFWVMGGPSTSDRWNLLKTRLLDVCPSYFSTSDMLYYQPENRTARLPDVFLLKFWCSYDRKGLLHDVTKVLCELELTIRRVKVSTTPDGRVMDLFFVTDSRELLHTKHRQEETVAHLRSVLGDAISTCEIDLVGADVAACSQDTPFLPHEVTEEASGLEILGGNLGGSPSSNPDTISVTMDNSWSPSHTIVQIKCSDHKGLVYDIMRTMKDLSIQVSYGRFSSNPGSQCDVELFTMLADGSKIVDPARQDDLRAYLKKELWSPLRVAVTNRGPDSELLVANPVELSGRGRPLVFYDITLALEVLNVGIFSVEIGRHMICNREFEVYRILLDERDSLCVPREKIEECVWNRLMGWD
ncbi:hypothetical protein MLD38_002555 [Melastoma candidum]|uniref:Uncharacterized protein n=1 Tax=Melastoma candidum TaxID=119954 RepID=A0ACB9RZ50_9MYRT|nr:hypothetical protein MLD38_002555 [Melastoma candidum]